MMLTGKTDHMGRTWIRCVECGDTKKHQNKAHCFVDSKGSTFCFRCGHSTQLSISTLLEIALGNIDIDEALEAADMAHDDVRPWISVRRTKLAVFGREDKPAQVCFPMRNHNGETVGWHDREPGYKGLNYGRRGLGFVGDKLTSSQSSPLVVVEGPYDVLSDRHVAVFGLITPSALRFLRLQHVWLFPDPDILNTSAKRSLFSDRVLRPLMDSLVIVEGVVLGNADPDEATITKHVPILDALEGSWPIL